MLLVLALVLFAVVDGVTFSFTGSQQVYNTPGGTCALQVTVAGGKGGGSSYSGNTSPGGVGHVVMGTINSPATQYFIYVGNQGTFGSSCGTRPGGSNSGGGANGGVGGDVGGGGGAASDIRTSTLLSSRIVVAGGGGAGSWYANGGAGGYPTGGNGASPGGGLCVFFNFL